MAKALSHIMATIRGSVGGLTYSANQFCQIVMKNRIAPVQPNTNAQTWVRQALNAASNAWLALVPADRTSWEDYASTVEYQGPQGTYKIGGRQMFIASYGLACYLKTRGFSPLTVTTDPPIIPGRLSPGSIDTAILGAPGTGFGVNITNDTSEDLIALIDISPPQNVTRNRYKGPWDDGRTTFIVVPNGVATPKSITGLNVGMAYFVRVRCLTNVSPHRISSVTYLRALASTVV